MAALNLTLALSTVARFDRVLSTGLLPCKSPQVGCTVTSAM